jgi:uncharacterized protein YjbJ (UPF0337 family)
LRIRNGFDRRVTRVRVHAHAGEVWACADREEGRMNKNELHGGARYLGGKVEKAVGDAVESRDWQVDGVVDQVAGGAENLYGRARSVAEDAADHAGAVAGRGGRAANSAVANSPAMWAIGAAMGGYLLGWLIHGERA